MQQVVRPIFTFLFRQQCPAAVVCFMASQEDVRKSSILSKNSLSGGSWVKQAQDFNLGDCYWSSMKPSFSSLSVKQKIIQVYYYHSTIWLVELL